MEVGALKVGAPEVGAMEVLAPDARADTAVRSLLREDLAYDLSRGRSHFLTFAHDFACHGNDPHAAPSPRGRGQRGV